MMSEKWLYWKAKEAEAVEERRQAEDELIKLLDVTTVVDSSKTHKPVPGLKINVTTRLNRRVNGDELQEIAIEHGLTDHLSALFRWKPEINAKAWQSAAPEITKVLEQAITTTASRPSFKITKEDK